MRLSCGIRQTQTNADGGPVIPFFLRLHWYSGGTSTCSKERGRVVIAKDPRATNGPQCCQWCSRSMWPLSDEGTNGRKGTTTEVIRASNS